MTVSSRSSCVCSFRASFLLEQRVASFKLLAVLGVTLLFVAVAFIPSRLVRKNAQQTLNYVCEDTFHFRVIPIPMKEGSAMFFSYFAP